MELQELVNTGVIQFALAEKGLSDALAGVSALDLLTGEATSCGMLKWGVANTMQQELAGILAQLADAKSMVLSIHRQCTLAAQAIGADVPMPDGSGGNRDMA